MSYSTELRTKLETGIQELEHDLSRLRAALAALDRHAAVRTPDDAAPTPRRRRSRGRPVGGELKPVAATTVSRLLAESDGMTTADLARRTNGGHEQILATLKQLERDGQARRTGTRRSTRWHATQGTSGQAADGSSADQAATASEPGPAQPESELVASVKPPA